MNSDTGTPDSTRIREMMATRDFEGALRELGPLLAAEPADPDTLYMAAVCCRYLQDYDRAQDLLDALWQAPRDLGRTYQEQGHLHAARNAPEKALAAFANATQANPALVASWQAQCRLLDALGRRGDARQALAQVRRLQALPKALVSVTDLLAQGRLGKADTLCRRFLQANPRNVEGMRLLAEIASAFGVLEDAEYLLESAAEFDPDNLQVKIEYVGILRRRQKFPAALQAAERLYREHPHNPQVQSVYAIEQMQVGDYQRAVELFDAVLQQLPGDAVTLTSRGHALKTWGRQEEAIASYRSAIAANPWHGDAYYALSNLKTYRFSAAERHDLRTLADREELGPASRVHVNFALGKAYEDEQDFGRAFEFYARGNALKRQASNYDRGQMSQDLREQRRVFTRDLLEQRKGAGCPDPDPIFIVGLPRAGSTLLEQILASHSQVEGTLELPNILSIAQKLRRDGKNARSAPYPDLLADLDDAQLASLGRRYLEETRVHRRGAPFFIDKMPNNFRHIGLIKLILPNARIIDARRHPMACCFSGFKQLFAEGQEFSYDLEDIGHYYNDYVALMDHWDAIAPGSVLRVHYENVVSDLEVQVRRLLAFCELPFEAACLDYHNTARPVRTASSEQVRLPIYDSGVNQWRNFSPHLGALESTLEPALSRYEDDLANTRAAMPNAG